MPAPDEPTPGSSDGSTSGSPGQHRVERLVGAVVLAACVLLVVVSLGQSLLGLSTFASTDVLGRVAPWSAGVEPGFSPDNDYVQDPVDAVLPGMAEVRERLLDGDVPQWSSLQSGGYEQVATPSLAVLSPLTAPYLALPLWLAPAYVKLLEIVVAIGGLFLFTRRLGLSRAAAGLGGLAFATSGFLVMWTNWPQTRVAALVPALFWSLERLLQTRNGRGVALVAVVVASMLAGGFPSIVTYSLLTAGPYVLVRVAVLERGRLRRALASVGLALAGVVAGALLLAVQLLPFVHLLDHGFVGDRTQDAERFLPLVTLVTAIAPDALGTTWDRDGWLGPRNPIESYSYVGVAVVLLACIGAVGGFVRHRRRSGSVGEVASGPGLAVVPVPVPVLGVRAFLVLAVVAWGVAVYAGGRWLELLQELPFMATNPIGRARAVLGFLVAVLAAIGFDRLLRAPPVRAGARALVAGGTAAVAARALRVVAYAGLAVALAALVDHAVVHATDAGFGGHLRSRVGVGLAVGLLALAAVVLSRFGSGRARLVGLVVLPLVVLGQALTVVVPFWPQVPRETVLPETATHRFLAERLGHDRFLPVGDAMMPGTNVAYGLRSLNGHAFMRASYADLLRAVDPQAFAAPSLWKPSIERVVAGGPLLDRLGVRYLVAGPDEPVAGSRTVHRATGAGAEGSAGSAGSASSAGTTASTRVALEPGSTLVVELDGGPLRGVGVVLAERATGVGTSAVVEVRVLDEAGDVLLEGSRPLADGAEPGGVDVALAGEDLPGGGRLTVELTLQADASLVLAAAGRPVDGAVAPAAVVVRPGDDALRLVRVGETVVYERLDALPRIRWAGTAAVEPMRATALERLVAGEDAEALLRAPGPPAEGSSAEVEVLEDSGDTIRVEVEADGAGYLVVADALQDAFTATVDGDQVPLRPADHGLVAVAVPAGEHEVELTYAAPYGGAGLVLSSTTAVGLLLLVLLDPLVRRRRRRTPSP